MHVKAIGALVAASLGWGLAGVGVRALFIDGATTFTVVLFRALFATVALVLFAVGRRTSISREAWRHGSAIGVLRIGAAPILFIGSLNFISAGFEALVITLVPVVTAVMARLMLGERLRRTQIIGLVLGLAGTSWMVISGDSGLAEGGNALAGAALAFGGVVTGSLSGVMSRRFAPLHPTAELAVPMFVSGLVFSGISALVLRDFEPSSVPSPSHWAILVALGLGSTLLPFMGTLYAAKHVSATTAALTGYVAPLIGLFGGVILLGEVITPAIGVGAVLTVAGVIAVGYRRSPTAAPVTVPRVH